MIINRSNVIILSSATISWVAFAIYLPSVRLAPLALLLGFVVAVFAVLYLVLTTSRGVKGYGEDSRQATSVARLSWTKDISKWQEEKAALKSRAEYRRPIIFPEAEKFSKALDGLLDLILQDYVTSWYRFISPRPEFKNEIDRSIRSVVMSFVARAAGKDLVSLAIDRFLPIVTGHLSDFYAAERSVRGKKLDYSVTEGTELDTAIATKYRNGNLHTVAALSISDAIAAQQDYARRLVVKLLPLVLPYSMTASSAVTVITREIVTCAVIAPLLRLLEDPDTWNQLIVNIAGPMLQDRKTVRKMRAALDEHAPASPKSSRTAVIPRLRPYDSERQFEKFIRGIRHVSALSDARRYRSELASQIRRDSALEGQDAVYLRRLETGRRVLDQKIAALTAIDGTKSRPHRNPTHAQASFRGLLTDAAGLSYFMEFMDRVKLMRLIQFWIVVEGFRNPLEGDTDEPSTPTSDDTERMDIAQMYEGYLVLPELQTSQSAIDAVRLFLKSDRSYASQQYMLARRAVLQTQTAAFERMRKEHFEAFKKSDLYYKWLAIEEQSGRRRSEDSSPSSSSPTRSSPTPLPRSSSTARRPQAGLHGRESELRKAVLSSADMRNMDMLKGTTSPTRRSLDDMRTRNPLFDDDLESSDLANSTASLQSLDADLEDVRTAQEEEKAVDAVQLALNDIVGEENLSVGESMFAEPAAELFKPHEGRALFPRSESGRADLASLGLVDKPSNNPVFVDDLFAHEAKKFPEDEQEGSDMPEHSDDDGVQEAAPGDLGLTEAIGMLNADIERLTGQQHIVASLTAKAELTNNTAELRILKKSEQSLQREIKRKEMQKQQYIVQESDNSLYGRAQLSIKSVMVGREQDGHEFALYVVEVTRVAGDNQPAAIWAVTRRYSQFHELHKRLRARFPAVRSIDFPRRQALFTLQKDFLEKRRATLERYLRSLLLVPAICRSRELRSFLSQSVITSPSASGEGNNSQADARDFVTRIYNSVSDGMEEFLGNIPVLDSLSLAGQNLISAAASQANAEGAGAIAALDPAIQDPATTAEAEAELSAYETKDLEPFVKPICDLFLEVFELSKGNSWLRGRTVVIVLHQLLGGTIERKVRESADSALEDDSLLGYVNMLKGIMWPDGMNRAAPVVRTEAQKLRTRKEAALLLDALLPDLAGSVVGRSKARAASRKIIAVLNNRRLNAHLVATFFDELIRSFFPEGFDK